MENSLQSDPGGPDGVGPEYVMKFGQRLREVRERLGLSQSELANETGWRQDSWSRVEGGYIKSVPLVAIAELCRLAIEGGVSLDWLLLGRGGQAKTERSVDGLRADPLIVRRLAESLLDAIEAMPGGQAVVARMGRTLSPGYETISVDELPRDWPAHYVPIVGRMAAGDGIPNDEPESTPPGWAMEYVAYEMSPAGSIAVRVVGESMEPDYRSGDIAIIDTRNRSESGVCCVLIADIDGGRNARLKKIKIENGNVVLSSLNAKYAPEAIPVRMLVAAYPILASLPALVETESEG